ncbi:lysophospholipid acyltransferase family protein [Nocardioides aurantiacus]|uniref:lysophospholipid acyltransferase family protein n=1 Tax=Nocardioides aurantiacus TaxID=86796 RepID=UPI00403F875E
MTAAPGVHDPGGDLLEVPRTALLTRARPVAQRLVRTWWRFELHGAEQFPAEGPVVVAANHVGWLDGPLLAICAPRPVHALTKQEMFVGPLGSLLTAAGQVPVDRHAVDRRAIEASRRALEQDQVVGVFPEGVRGSGDMATSRPGAAYLALVTGAPVVPVSFLGTREPGGHADSLPPRGSRLVMTVGAPLRLGRRSWPRTTAEVAGAAARVTAAIVETTRQAETTTGLRLPGPLGPPPTPPIEAVEKQP